MDPRTDPQEPASALGTVESLHDEARAATGLEDFGDDAHVPGLEVLLRSYAREAGLTPGGAAAAHDDLVSILVARLVSEQGWTQFPAHAEVTIERPVIVVGLPRTGTTTLHRMLAADPRHQGLEMWLGYEPQPRPAAQSWSANATVRRVQDGLDRFFAARPGYEGVHAKNATAVEECWLLTRQSMASAYFGFTHRVPSYDAWLAGQDMHEVYRRHRRNLQLIGLGDRRRWVLKYSGHLLCLDALLDAYPDALVVRTHRAPATTVMSSMCSMVEQLTAGSSTTFRGRVLARTLLDQADAALRRFDADRRRHRADTFLDLDFARFAEDPLGSVEEIHRRLGQPTDDEARRAMSAVLAEDDRVRKHHYRSGDIELPPDEVERRLGGRT